MPKSRNRRKSHIKHAKYESHNFSALESHPRDGKSLASPYRKMPAQVSFSSWKDDYLPNILWAAVVATNLSRDDYLALFRRIIHRLREIADPDHVFITHNWLAALTRDEFLVIMEPVRDYPSAYSALASITQIESLPDKDHWRAFVQEKSSEKTFEILARAIAGSFFHQSELATDLRWFKVMALCITGRISFGSKFNEQIEELRLYPNHGDMHAVRPSIRAMEMGCRPIEMGLEGVKDIAKLDANAIWNEFRKNTDCIVDRPNAFSDVNNSALLDELTEISIDLSNHADTVAPSTGIDARRDAAFGLSLYALAITLETASSQTHVLAGGRVLLRTITEVAITLGYLIKKDESDTWHQYRTYGMGQAKLAFLKNVRMEDIPSFISLDELHEIANDDTWMEFLDINLGPWEKLNLRQMAEQADLKDLYDQYYTWSSGYTHGHWAAVRDTVFTTCLNPLHRFHRVYFPPRQMRTVLEDCCKLINIMLDNVNKIYPTFSRRVTWHETLRAKPPNESK